VIREKLIQKWAKFYEKGELNESAAYELAQLKPEYQEVIFAQRKESEPIRWMSAGSVEKHARHFAEAEKITCKMDGGMPCDNLHHMCVKIASTSCWTNPCSKCCDKCENLASCKYACPKLAEKVQKLKADAKEARRQEKQARADADRPIIEAIQKFWTRFGEARRAAQMSWGKCCKTMEIGEWALGGKDGVAARERGEDKISTNTTLPYGYNCYLHEIRKLVSIADLFGCSLDYLLCRADDPKGMSGAAVSASAGTWCKGVPDHPCTVVGVFDCGKGVTIQQIVRWDGECFRFTHGAKVEAECVRWYPLPEEDAV